MTHTLLALFMWVAGVVTGVPTGAGGALPSVPGQVVRAEPSPISRDEKPPTRAGEDRATNKERFDLCIAMLKSYYDAIEARFSGTMAFMVIVIGWLVTSESTRAALRANPWLRHATIGTLSILIVLYAWNIDHWLDRWREIRDYTEKLNYVEPKFYSRYHSIPALSWYTYMLPVVTLYGVVLVCVRMITLDRFLTSTSDNSASFTKAESGDQAEGARRA